MPRNFIQRRACAKRVETEIDALRRMHVANLHCIIDIITTARATNPQRVSLNDVMDDIVQRIDWDEIKPEVLKSTLALIISFSSMEVSADLYEEVQGQLGWLLPFLANADEEDEGERQRFQAAV